MCGTVSNCIYITGTCCIPCGIMYYSTVSIFKYKKKKCMTDMIDVVKICYYMTHIYIMYLGTVLLYSNV